MHCNFAAAGQLAPILPLLENAPNLGYFAIDGDTTARFSVRPNGCTRYSMQNVPLKIDAMKTPPARTIMAIKVPRSVLLLFLLAVVAWVLHPFFFPSLRSYFEWTFHRTSSFEGESIRVPMGWSSGDPWHLLSLRRPHFFAYAQPESTIIIDPFAERHPGKVEEAWQLQSHLLAKPVSVISGARCAQNFIPEIYCLSPDSSVVIELWGNGNDLSAFREVYRQASAIAGKHPGRIAR